MVYIPKAWIINDKNELKVHELLDKLDNDIIVNDEFTKENVISELKSMREYIIAEKLTKNEITFGA